MNALVLLNSASPGYREGYESVLPYLDHLGVPYRALDVLRAPLPADLAEYALLVAAHRRLGLAAPERRALLAAAQGGAGLVSFDPALPAAAEIGIGGPAARPPAVAARAEAIELAPQAHYITAQHAPGETMRLVRPWRVPALAARPADVLAWAGERALLAATALGRGRLVRWASAGWMRTTVLGPLAGLDDLFWRGLVWAARKPFALRGLPPLVTMRVDDVAGRGGLWGESPFYWVEVANRHGLKPWLGLFIYNMSPAAVDQLRDLIRRGQATAFPHAFGWPAGGGHAEYHCPEGLPHRGGELDDFIFFDHHGGRPWPAEEAARGLRAVDDWYAARAPLPLSPYALAHWYEMGSNVVPHVRARWGAEFTGKPMAADLPLADSTPWLQAGPFRRYEEPGTCYLNPRLRGDRPVYYADTVDLGGQPFFNCITEIHDIAGYEWCPDNDVAGTVERGVRQLRRALDSMALASLFTHEDGRIFRMHPQAWTAAIAGIAAGIAEYDPIYVTADEGVRYVRATRTSRLERCRHDRAAGRVVASLSGHADLPTHFRLFTESRAGIEARLADVPPFTGKIDVQASLGG